MKHIWKSQVWAAILTVATLLTVTGCKSDENNDESSVDLSNISSAMVDEGSTEAISTDYAYIMNPDGTISISGYNGADTALEIPTTIDGYVVTQIGDHAFEANHDITSVTLPNGLVDIGESAFSDCSSLSAIVIPDTVGTISRAAFVGCTSLESLHIPASVSEITEEAFTGCSKLIDLTIESDTLQYTSWGLDKEVNSTDLVITCPVGSPIEEWAEKNGFNTSPLS